MREGGEELQQRRWMQPGPSFGTRGPTFQCEGRRRQLGRPRRARDHAALLELVVGGAALEARVEAVGDHVKLLQGVLDGVVDVVELLAKVGVPVLLVVGIRSRRQWRGPRGGGGCVGSPTCTLVAGGVDAVCDLLRHLTELRNAAPIGRGAHRGRVGGPRPACTCALLRRSLYLGARRRIWGAEATLHRTGTGGGEVGLVVPLDARQTIGEHVSAVLPRMASPCGKRGARAPSNHQNENEKIIPRLVHRGTD